MVSGNKHSNNRNQENHSSDKIYPLGFLGASLLLPVLPKPPLEPPVFDEGVVDGLKILTGLSTVVDGVPDGLFVGGAITLRIKLPKELSFVLLLLLGLAVFVLL